MELVWSMKCNSCAHTHTHAHAHTHTHTQSQNHGEYVFDTGSEQSKQEWIKMIQQFCNRPTQNHTPNGHIAM